MTQEEKINYWINLSEMDVVTMNNLFNSKDFHWSLYIGHLVIEKLLKALIVKVTGEVPPFTHNLLKLCLKSKLTLTQEQQDILAEINTFNIEAKYPDVKLEFFKKCTYSYTKINIQKIMETREWLKQLITK